MFSRSHRLEIQLTGERPGGRKKTFRAGDAIKGRIVTDVEGFTALYQNGGSSETLKLIFWGVEKASILRNDSIYKAQRKLCESVCVIHPDWQTISAARVGIRRYYVVPFEIETPHFLPSSFSETSQAAFHSKTLCSISYHMRVVGQTNGQILAEREVHCRAKKVPQMIVPATISPDLHHVSGFMHLKSGPIRIAARVQDVHVGRGQELRVFIVCTNSSGVTIQSVDLKLKELVSWRAQGKQEQVKLTRVQMTDVGASLPGIERRSGTSSIRPTTQDLYEMLRDSSNMVKMVIPKDCRNSYARGKAVNIKHDLSITFVCSGTNAKIRIPLTIVEEELGSASALSVVPAPASASASPNRTPPIAMATPTGPPPPPVAPQRPPPTAPQQQQRPTAPMASAVPTGAATPTAPMASDAPVAVAVAPTTGTPDDSMIVAQAMLIPDDNESFRATLVSAPLATMTLGGELIFVDDDDGDEAATSRSASVAALRDAENTWEGLRRELHLSIEDYSLLRDYVNNPRWAPLLASLTPDQYGEVLLLVDVEPDQVKVAELLAKHIKDYPGVVFTCDHAICGFTSVARWVRPNTMERILPYCDPQDVQRHGQSIRNLLTDLELCMTRSIFRALHISASTTTMAEGQHQRPDPDAIDC